MTGTFTIIRGLGDTTLTMVHLPRPWAEQELMEAGLSPDEAADMLDNPTRNDVGTAFLEVKKEQD